MGDRELESLYKRLVDIEDINNLKEKKIQGNDIELTYFEIEDRYLDFIRESQYYCYIFTDSKQIHMNLSERANGSGKYIVIEFIRYNKIAGKNGNVYYLDKKERETIIINEDLSIYTYIKDKAVPITYSYLSKKRIFNEEVFNKYIIEIFKYFSEKHLLFRELTNEYKNKLICLPIRINDIWEYRTKYDLLNGYCKNYRIPKNINKYPIQLTYLLTKCQKYVKENEYQKLVKTIINYDYKLEFINNHREQLKSCLYLYYKINIENERKKELDENEEYLVEDYIDMKLRYDNDKIFNLNIKSIKRIESEHDRLTIKLRNKKTPIIKIPKDSKFKNLKLPIEFERIKTRKRLITESVINNNCVWSYAEKINKDKSAIYSVIYDNKRYTLEIKERRKKYYLAQISGYGNSSAPVELIEKIKNIIKK